MVAEQFQRNGDAYAIFDEVLIVRVPKQENIGVVEIVSKDFDSPQTNEFTLIRPLANFWIKNVSDDTAVLKFNPPMELLAGFTQDYLDQARSLKPGSKKPDAGLVLAYFDPNLNGGQWVRLPRKEDTFDRHAFIDGFDDFGGYRGFHAIKVKTWLSDPGTGWGL